MRNERSSSNARRLWLIVFLLATTALFFRCEAQRLTERWLTINPLGERIQSSDKNDWAYLTKMQAWGEFGPYRIQRDNDHAWSVKIGGFVELLRLRNDQSLAFLSSIDLIADPHNEMRFNPRAVFWEEGFLYTIRTSGFDYQIGYYQRCKHDIDNLLAAPSYPYESVQRALMYGSLLGKLLFPFTTGIPNDKALLALRLDVYTILQDDRLPKRWMDMGTNLEQAMGTLGGNFHFRGPMAEKSVEGFITAYGALTFYGKERGFTQRFKAFDSGRFSGGLAGGVALTGVVQMRIGFSYEYLHDTSITVVPRAAHLVLLSIALVDPATMW